MLQIYKSKTGMIPEFIITPCLNHTLLGHQREGLYVRYADYFELLDRVNELEEELEEEKE